jgi:hypothetical protein
VVTKTERWRDRAEELRVIAESMKEESAKHDLLALSRKWHEMAARADSKPAATPSLKPAGKSRDEPRR